MMRINVLRGHRGRMAKDRAELAVPQWNGNHDCTF